MSIENVVSALLPQTLAMRVLRLIEFVHDAAVPSDPPPPGTKRTHLPGSRPDRALADPPRSTSQGDPSDTPQEFAEISLAKEKERVSLHADSNRNSD